MKNQKTLTALLLCMALLVTLFGGAAVATAGETAVITVESGAKTADEAGLITLDVTLANNPGIAEAGFDVLYDGDCLKLIGVTDVKTGFGKSVNGSAVNLNENIDGNVTANGRLFRLQFQALKSGKTDVSLQPLKNNGTNIVNMDAKAVPVTFTAGSVEVKTCAVVQITQAKCSEQTVSVTLDGCCDAGTQVFAAGYDPEGKLLCLKSLTLQKLASSAQLQLPGASSAASVRVFITDSGGVPIAKSADCVR